MGLGISAKYNTGTLHVAGSSSTRDRVVERGYFNSSLDLVPVRPKCVIVLCCRMLFSKYSTEMCMSNQVIRAREASHTDPKGPLHKSTHDRRSTPLNSSTSQGTMYRFSTSRDSLQEGRAGIVQSLARATPPPSNLSQHKRGRVVHMYTGASPTKKHTKHHRQTTRQNQIARVYRIGQEGKGGG